MKRGKKSRWIKRGVMIMGIIIIIIFSLLLLSFSEKTFGSLNKPHYYLEVEADPNNGYARNFQIYYDFVNGHGSISFEIYNPRLQFLRFILPEGTKRTSLNLKNASHSGGAIDNYYVEGRDYSVKTLSSRDPYNPDNTVFWIDNLSSSIQAGNTFVDLEFESKMIPNAKFTFEPTLSDPRTQTGDKKGIFITLNLGDIYPCTEKCYHELSKNIKLDGNKLITVEAKGESADRQITSSSFELNYDKKLNTFLGMKISRAYEIIMLVFGLFSFLVSFWIEN